MGGEVWKGEGSEWREREGAFVWRRSRDHVLIVGEGLATKSQTLLS